MRKLDTVIKNEYNFWWLVQTKNKNVDVEKYWNELVEFYKKNKIEKEI